jgi:predicted RecA/RadA family phage recombinase
MATITITPANFIPSSSAVYLGTVCIAGETIAAGNTVYIHTDGKFYRAAAATLASSTAVGIAANGGAANQRINVVSSDTAAACGSVFTAAGRVLVLSEDYGQLGDVADLGTGDYATVAGVSVSASTLQFDFSKRLPGVV